LKQLKRRNGNAYYEKPCMFCRLNFWQRQFVVCQTWACTKFSVRERIGLVRSSMLVITLRNVLYYKAVLLHWKLTCIEKVDVNYSSQFKDHFTNHILHTRDVCVFHGMHV